jgi:tetratricopeptide (TPR) repeat protein
VTRTRRLAVVCLLMASATLAAQDTGKSDYDDLYRDAVRHVRNREWRQAEEKLVESRRKGPESGRGVIRRGLLGRDDYFPEFYLGVVYLNTNRPALALPQFQTARQRGINPKESEFRQIDEFEIRANAMIEAEKRNAPPAPDPREQFKTFFGQAQRALNEGRYDDAEAAAKQARSLNVDNAAVDAFVLKLGMVRGNSRLQQQLRGNPSLPELRKLLSEYEGPGVSVEEIRRRITASEAGEATAARARGERASMVEYYLGNYQKALSAIADAEKSAPLSARGYFYRACILASLATRGKTMNQAQLREARRYYTLAAQQPAAFKDDLRYVSPRILQLLQGA